MQKNLYIQYYNSPIGKLGIIANDNAVIRILFDGEKTNLDAVNSSNKVIEQTVLQLGEYFAGERKNFEIAVEFSGTEFQKQAWDALRTIPFGKKVSYSEQATKINKPKAVRAIGAANSRNPIPVIVPCHRVVGKNGSLTGFAGGLKTKQFLLDHESKTA